ncbi:MAG: Fe-S protein assembly co-chaperone HscB [Planctomycetota bacterium]
MANPFETFDLTPAFDLDLEALHQRFLAASAENHPDRFTDPLDQADAAERSSEINHAYRTLTDPEARANALLAVLGGPAPEDDKSLPPTFLMEMMAVREELEDAEAANDAAALSRLRQDAQNKRQHHVDQLSTLFAADPVDGKAVRLELNAMRYIERMLEQMPNA